MRVRFWIAAVMLVAFYSSLLTTVWILSPPTRVVPVRETRLLPITNKTAPNVVERHFAEGKEYSQFPATAVQMRDGTCYAYTNQVSWLAMECFGTVMR